MCFNDIKVAVKAERYYLFDNGLVSLELNQKIKNKI